MFSKSMGFFMVRDVVHWEMSNNKLKRNKRFFLVFVVVVLKIHALIFSPHFKIMSRPETATGTTLGGGAPGATLPQRFLRTPI